MSQYRKVLSHEPVASRLTCVFGCDWVGEKGVSVRVFRSMGQWSLVDRICEFNQMGCSVCLVRGGI